MIFACIPPWVYPAWDSLNFLALSECFLSHVRGVFMYNLFTYFLGPFLSLLFWEPYNVNESSSVVSIFLRPHGLYIPWDSPGQNTAVGSLSLLQRIFPSQGSNTGLPHCRQILYQLSQKGSPRILQWVTYPFSTRSSRPRNWTRVSCIAGRFFTNWAIREINVNVAFNVPWVSLTAFICFPFFPFILLCSSISTICLPAQLPVLLPHLTCHWFL